MTDKAELEKMARPTAEPAPPSQLSGPTVLTSDIGLAAVQAAPGNMATQRAARVEGGAEAAWAQYPVLTRLLPAAVLAGRASALAKIPVKLLLRPELMFEDRDIWNDFLTNRQNGESDAAASALLRNEMLRSYFRSIGLSMSDPVVVQVTPPAAPGDAMRLSFQLKGRELLTPDGMIDAAELAALGPIEPVVAKVRHDADNVELAAALLAGIAELRPAVETMALDLRLNPEDFAMNGVFDVERQVREAKRLLDRWSCSSGPTLAATSHLIADYEDILLTAHYSSNFAKGWHREHTMESAQQANARRGAAVGKWYDFAVAGFWASVETVEQVGTLGSHGTRTKIQEAYADGDISWNEARDLVNRSARRAIIAATVMRILSPLIARFGTGVLGGFAISGTARTVVGGVIGGAGGSAGQLAAQSLLTRFADQSLSPAGRRIWSASGPGGRDWAIGVPLGGLLGGLFAARAPIPPGGAPSTPAVPLRSGFFPKVALWTRLRLGEPIMRGVSGQNAELLGGPTEVPALSLSETPGAVSRAAPSATPWTAEPQAPTQVASTAAPAVSAKAAVASAEAPAVSAPLGEAPMIALGYRPAPGERQVTREQWKQFSSDVRWENRLARSFSEEAPYQTGDLEEIARIRRPRQNVSVPFFADIGLSDAQTSAAGRVFGKLWDANVRQAWRACDNALARQRMAEVRRLWNLGDAASRQAARDLARSTFNQWVSRFWRRVMNDPALTRMFTDAGQQVVAGRAPFYMWADGFEEGVTIEHWGSRLSDDPTRAVDDTNLMFSMHRENVHMLEELRRGGW